MDLGIIILSEINQRKTNIKWYHLYVELKKTDTNEHIYKIDTENKFYGYQRRKGAGEG